MIAKPNPFISYISNQFDFMYEMFPIKAFLFVVVCFGLQMQIVLCTFKMFIIVLHGIYKTDNHKSLYNECIISVLCLKDNLLKLYVFIISI